MASSQKIIAVCFCLLLTSPGFLVEAGYGMMGMFGGGGGHGGGGNEALEALLAVGILAMLFRNHGHGLGLGRSFGFGPSLRFGHGLGLGHGLNMGHSFGGLGQGLSLRHGLGLRHSKFPFKRSPIAQESILTPILRGIL